MDTTLYNAMTNVANKIKDIRTLDMQNTERINAEMIWQKQTEARYRRQINEETEFVEVPPKTKDGLPTTKEVSKYTNQTQRDDELQARLSLDQQYIDSVERSRLLQQTRLNNQIDVEFNEMLFKAALSQNQREARMIAITSAKTVVVSDGKVE